MLSAPSAIAKTNDITFRPGCAAPGRSRRTARPLRQLLDSKPRRQHRHEHQSRVGHRALVIELDLHAVQPHARHRSPRGDLLSPGPGCLHSPR